MTFYGGIAPGEPLIREHDKKGKPLPKFTRETLLVEVPELVENHRVCYDQHGIACQGDCAAERPCACSPLNHSQLDQLGFVGKAMAIGRRRGFSDMATEIVTVCACGGMAKEIDSRRGSYHKHHPVQRTCLSR